MTKKKATIILEGNQHQADKTIHELTKLISQADSLPELSATLQTTDITDSEHEPHFTEGSTDGP